VVTGVNIIVIIMSLLYRFTKNEFQFHKLKYIKTSDDVSTRRNKRKLDVRTDEDYLEQDYAGSVASSYAVSNTIYNILVNLPIMLRKNKREKVNK
jgi:hypothetical protein